MSIIIIILIILLILLTILISLSIFKKDKYIYPETKEVDFKFKKECRNKNGVIGLYNSSKPDEVMSGNLLACNKILEYGTPEVTIASEIQDIVEKITKGDYNPQNEEERLRLYFKLVYPNSEKWDELSLIELENFYTSLEFYYKLPVEIMPTTPIVIHRTKAKQFYRVPNGVILDQDFDRKGITNPYIEVTHFGSMNAFLRNPSIFSGTYYYPAKGTGLFIPIGKSLIAYNKVHAMKLLDVPNTDIVKIAGRDFQSFLNKDSNALWKLIKSKNKDVNKQDYWKKVCVIDKTLTKQEPNCSPLFNYFTKEIYYIPEALNTMINEMVSGKSLRLATRKQLDDTMKQINVYYGIGNTGDNFLSQIARNRGYDSIQFLREAQMSIADDAVVGNEFLHLYEPIYSQSYLMRLDPFIHDYTNGINERTLPRVNYLLDNTIKPVSVKMLTNSDYNPWTEEHIDIDVIVSERN